MALKLLREVEYQNHIRGTRYHAMAGAGTVLMTHLHEVNDFLSIDSPESLKLTGGGGAINYIDLNKLKDWIAQVFDDQELSNAIGEEIERGSCYADRVGPTKQLIAERLHQCRSLLQI